MRYFGQFSVVAVVCFIITGCAGRFAQPPRETISFDYVPRTEAPPGSADVTFAIVGVKFVAPTVHQQAVPLQQSMVLPSTATSPLLFLELVGNMTRDFGEVLTARGFTVKGSYRTLDEMIYPDKEESDLILTAHVKFVADATGIEYKSDRRIIWSGCVLGPLASSCLIAAMATPKSQDQAFLLLVGGGLTVGGWALLASSGYVPSGGVEIGCEVELEAYEGLTGEIMWSKRIPITPFTVKPEAIIKRAAPEIIKRASPRVITWQQLMKIDNKFYSDLGRVLETQYDRILNQIYIYLDPREMAIVKNQAMELRKRKVY